MDSSTGMDQDQKNGLEKVKDQDLQDAVVETKFLALSWLNDFEKRTFDGKTVKELLNHR